MSFECKVCNKSFKLKHHLQNHNNSLGHLAQQAVCDNELDAHYKTEMDKLKAELSHEREMRRLNEELARSRLKEIKKLEEDMQKYKTFYEIKNYLS